MLRVAIREPSTLDPLRIQDPGSVLVARQLYEGLTRWDAVEQKVVPAAAESWKVKEKGRTFVFKLREDMTFHNGAPVTSRDFAFAFDRIALKKNASELAYTLEPVKGFGAVNQLGTRKHLSGIRAPRDRTLVIRLNHPLYNFPAVLTHPGLVPVPRRAVKRLNRFLSRPIGNGPFRMARRWAVGEGVVLQAFDEFFRPPKLNGIRFIPFSDPTASWLDFSRGDLDVVEVPPGQFEAAAESFGEDGFKPFLAGYFFGVNVQKKGLNNLRARRAVSLAIDREAIAKTVFKDTMIPPRGIVPAGMPGFKKNICRSPCRHAPRVAKRLVAKVAPRHRDIRLEYTKEPGQPHRRVARMVAGDLEAAGFSVKVRGSRFGRYVRRLRAGRPDVYRLGWIAEYPSPDVFLFSLFASDSPDNHSGYKSVRTDRLLKRARAQPSTGRRARLYAEAEKRILRALPVIPIGTYVTHWAHQPEVEGLTFDALGGFDATSVSLAE